MILLAGCGSIIVAIVIAEMGNIEHFAKADKFISYSGGDYRLDIEKRINIGIKAS